jgi:hypothetical protein
MLYQRLRQALNLEQAKVAGKTPVMLRLMQAGAPVETDMKSHETGQLICSGVEEVCHLRGDCRKERPDKNCLGGGRPGLQNATLPPFHARRVSQDDRQTEHRGMDGEKPCVMSIGTGTSLTMARLFKTAGLPERKQPAYVQQMASGKTLPLSDESITGLDVLHVHDTTVNLKHCVLRLG